MPRWVSSKEFLSDPSEDVVVQKFADAEMDEDGRRVRYVISDGSVDRENDTIATGGWDVEAYRKNPVVLWAHSHRDLPVAKAVEITERDGRIEAVAEFADHPFAETVFQLVKGGFMRAVSVGFRPKEWTINEERGGIDFKAQELLEFSVVPVPANPRALMAASAEGIDLEPLRKWLGDTIEAWPGEPGELKLPDAALKKIAPPAEDSELLKAVCAEFSAIPDVGKGDITVAAKSDVPESPKDAPRGVTVTRRIGDMEITYTASTVAEVRELIEADQIEEPAEEVSPQSATNDDETVFEIELDEPDEIELDIDDLEALVRKHAIGIHAQSAIDYLRGA